MNTPIHNNRFHYFYSGFYALLLRRILCERGLTWFSSMRVGVQLRGRLHTSQLELAALLMKVQCSQVHMAPPSSAPGEEEPTAPALPPGIGGRGADPAPTNDVCREVGGDGPENETIFFHFTSAAQG